MKHWVVEFLRSRGDERISKEELDRDLAIPSFCYSRLAGCFRILAPLYYDRSRLYWLIGYVLGNLPEDVFLTIQALNMVFVCSDSLGSVAKITEPGVLISFNRILSLRDDEGLGVIVHEVAHALGGELFGILNAIDGLESRADDLASEWGFKEEIDAIRRHFKSKGEKDNG